ncbi:MAG TPA: hypothetical protein VMT08_22920 [Bradyrhizobium sp.]|nr:hypothetical protein [Bradyrhizobium sp.]
MGNCSWRTVEFGPHSFGIERGAEKVLLGYIDLIDERWHVEILLPGSGRNIEDFADYASALGFVEKTLAGAPPSCA